MWNNTEDRATLEDADGHVLDQCPYRGSSAGHTNLLVPAPFPARALMRVMS